MTKEELNHFKKNHYFIVEIKEDDNHLGIKAGHQYFAQSYHLDPNSKVTLLRRVTKDSRSLFKKSPDCNQYISNCKIIITDYDVLRILEKEFFEKIIK